MGLLTMALARRRGAARTILSDPMPERREVARRLGADHVVDPVVSRSGKRSSPSRMGAVLTWCARRWGSRNWWPRPSRW